MSMTALEKLQHTFQSRVLTSDSTASIAWVSASGRATPLNQLSIYSYAYGARLKEVLANDYPATLKAVGVDHFEQLAEDYIQAHPSSSFSLRDFGRHLSAFMLPLTKKGGCFETKPWLYDLVVFEWTLGQAFDAADASLFNEQDMSTIAADAWPELRFIVHPSVFRLDFEWNIPEMWKSLTKDGSVQINAVHEPATPWLIWREQLVTRFRSMEHDEQQALDKVCEGGSFNEVCDLLATRMSEDEVPLRAAGLLKGWITHGLISDIQ